MVALLRGVSDKDAIPNNRRDENNLVDNRAFDY